MGFISTNLENAFDKMSSLERKSKEGKEKSSSIKSEPSLVLSLQ